MSAARHIAAYVLLQVALFGIVVPWGVAVSFVLVLAAIWIGAISFTVVPSLRDFIRITILLVLIVGGMLLAGALLARLRYSSAAQSVVLVAFPFAIALFGIRQELRRGEATRAI